MNISVMCQQLIVSGSRLLTEVALEGIDKRNFFHGLDALRLDALRLDALRSFFHFKRLLGRNVVLQHLVVVDHVQDEAYNGGHLDVTDDAFQVVVDDVVTGY